MVVARVSEILDPVGGAQVTTVSHLAGSMAIENARGLVATYLVNLRASDWAMVGQRSVTAKFIDS